MNTIRKVICGRNFKFVHCEHKRGIKLGISFTNLLKRNLDFRLVTYILQHPSKYYGTSKIIKGLFFFCYRLFKSLFLDLTKEHVVEVNGYKLLTIPNDLGISSELLLFKTHEPLSTEVLKSELKKGMVCLSVGANIGYYALLERKLVGEEGAVIVIEPSPLSYSCLKNNLHQNGFADVSAFNYAFSCHDGAVPFLMDSQSNLCRVVKENDHCLSDLIIDVRALSLDSFAAQYNLDELDFLRMDVEGYETEIFRGGWRTIDRFKPALFIEIHKSLLGPKLTFEFLQDLQRHGYEVKHYIPRDLDLPLIGNMRDVKEIKISRLLEMLSDNLLPDCFHLFLVQSGEKSITEQADSSSTGDTILNADPRNVMQFFV